MFIIRQKQLNVNTCLKCLEQRRFFSDHESNMFVLKNFFDLRPSEAREYIAKHKLNQISSDRLTKVINYCENVGFNKDDILKAPAVLRIQPTTLDQYYCVMTEGGFIKITPKIISKFRTWCKSQINVLKRHNLINPQTNVAESFKKFLSPCPEDFSIKNYNDSDTWAEAHMKVLTQYLKWRLNVDSDEIYKLLTVHRQVCRKSFRYLCENIALAEELDFSQDKILKYGYILRAYPKQTREILETFPIIAGVSMKKAMRMYPKLMTTPAANIQKIYDILKVHNISEEAISKRLNVFNLSPETVEFRLKELERDKDMKVLLHTPDILKLVVHLNRAKSRLQFLKQLHLKCASISLLGNDDNRFDDQIKEGKDINNSRDTFSFLKGIFRGFDGFENRLKKHPYYLQVPLSSMEETYTFFLRNKFTNTAICEVIYILLYPKEKIQDSLKKLAKYQKENNQELTEVNKLNLVLYFIEKEHHFTGDGVWVKTELVEESVHNV